MTLSVRDATIGDAGAIVLDANGNKAVLGPFDAHRQQLCGGTRIIKGVLRIADEVHEYL